MKLEKAIEILNLQNILTSPNLEPDLIAANNLGIEALKRCQSIRRYTRLWQANPLPGETQN